MLKPDLLDLGTSHVDLHKLVKLEKYASEFSMLGGDYVFATPSQDTRSSNSIPNILCGSRA